MMSDNITTIHPNSTVTDHLTLTTTSDSLPPARKRPNLGLIIGLSVGGATLLVILMATLFYCIMTGNSGRRRPQQRREHVQFRSGIKQEQATPLMEVIASEGQDENMAQSGTTYSADGIDFTLTECYLEIEAHVPAQYLKPSLSSTRWRSIQKSVNPQSLESLRLEEINIARCHQELFNFTKKCTNLKSFLVYNITGEHSDCRDIVSGIQQTLPGLEGLKELDIWGVSMGKSVLENLTTSSLHVLSLVRTELSDSGAALVSCISHLPFLSYLHLLESGLKEKEILDVLHGLPENCPGLIALDIARYIFKMPDIACTSSLLHLKSICFSFIPADQYIEIIDKLPTDLEMIYLGGKSVIANTESLLDVVRRRRRLRYLVVDEGRLGPDAEWRLKADMKKREGKLVVHVPGSKEFEEYKDEVAKLKQQCIDSS